MKNIYEAPIVVITIESNEDIISTSGGDTPLANPFDW